MQVWMAEADVVPAPRKIVGDVMTLDSGRSVWLESFNEAVPTWSSEPQAPARGVIVLPRNPANDDVRAPGWLLTGVNFQE